MIQIFWEQFREACLSSSQEDFIAVHKAKFIRPSLDRFSGKELRTCSSVHQTPFGWNKSERGADDKLMSYGFNHWNLCVSNARCLNMFVYEVNHLHLKTQKLRHYRNKRSCCLRGDDRAAFHAFIYHSALEMWRAAKYYSCAAFRSLGAVTADTAFHKWGL